MSHLETCPTSHGEKDLDRIADWRPCAVPLCNHFKTIRIDVSLSLGYAELCMGQEISRSIPNFAPKATEDYELTGGGTEAYSFPEIEEQLPKHGDSYKALTNPTLACH